MKRRRRVRHTRLPSQPCPECGLRIDKQSHLTHAPSAGDFTICFRCYAVLRFEADLQFRVARPEEYAGREAEFAQRIAILARTKKEHGVDP